MMTRKDWTEVTASVLGGAGIGAALMYLLDPESGTERRRYVARTAGDAWGTAAETARHAGESLGEAWSGVTDRARHLSEDMLHYGQKAGRHYAKRTRHAAERARDMMPTGYFHRESEWSDTTTTALAVCGALALGAGLMFLLDPQSGRRRRALIRDKAVHYAHEAGDAVAARSKDMRNRAVGMYHETRKAVTGSQRQSQETSTTSPTSSPSGQGEWATPGGTTI